MGIYIGPENEEQPEDATKYEWSKYGGESNYIDIRYSNNGEIFTENNGLTQGSWIGFWVTNDSSVLDPNYIPVWENYSWNNLSAAAGVTTPIYYIETNYKTVSKFFTSDLKYSYIPSTLKIYFKMREADTMGQVSRGSIQLYYTYYDLNDTETILTSDVITANTEFDFSLTDDIFKNRNLQDIIISGILENQTLITEIIQINYGTTEDMAKLALNASDIVASIANTKLTFNTDGLTVKNGGLAILNNYNEKVFYADENGNLFFAGALSTASGNLGGWNIDEYGLYSDNGVIGLYAGGELVHPEDPLNSPLRFWAGKYINEEQITYNFAVNHNGNLFAKNASIIGKIIATDGHIQNKFLVGSNESGIILYGGDENTKSYIGSAQYSSGQLGYGWKLDQDGTAEFNNVTARGKIQSSVFEYNKISSVGGSLYIAPTIYIESASQPINSGTMIINGEQVSCYKVSWNLPYASLVDLNGRDWKIGDEIKLDGNILTSSVRLELSDIDGIITSAISNNDSTTTITVSFPIQEYNNTQLTSLQFEPGAIIILYGSEEKRHGLYLTSAGQNSPYMDVYDDSEDNVVKPAVRIGNLTGINDTNFSQVSLEGYGLYSSNAYLRGQLILPNAGISNQKTIGYAGEENYFIIDPEDEKDNNAIRIWAGAGYPSLTSASEIAPFIVTQDGSLYAKKGIFQGVVKATNSEFSGTIKAAGIVIEDGSLGNVYSAKNDHFFVAYKEEPTSFNDYVLDIGAHGLSIWEGGLRAYSDYASGLEDTTYINPVYGYSLIQTNPQPYFSLADDGNGEELHARIVAHKGHFLTVEQSGVSYQTNSIIFDKGIWFDESNYNNVNNIEYTAYYQASHSNGLSLKNGLLDINHYNGISFNTQETIYVNPNLTDIDSTRIEKMLIRGQLNLISENEEIDNLISLNGQVIKEAFDINKMTSIGIDIIVS